MKRGGRESGGGQIPQTGRAEVRSEMSAANPAALYGIAHWLRQQGYGPTARTLEEGIRALEAELARWRAYETTIAALEGPDERKEDC